jgi:hypothetical protein
MSLLRTMLDRFALHREPDFYVGGQANPYLERWFIKRDAQEEPREDTRGFNVFLHRFRRSDDDRALHDHPWANCSILLSGTYLEVMPGAERGDEETMFVGAFGEPQRALRRRAGSVVFRKAEQAHRLIIDDGDCWSLFVTGRKVREWGFHCPRGWVHWRDFVDDTDHGSVGRGCN